MKRSPIPHTAADATIGLERRSSKFFHKCADQDVRRPFTVEQESVHWREKAFAFGDSCIWLVGCGADTLAQGDDQELAALTAIPYPTIEGLEP